jgi:hypothetical protein
MQNNTTMPLNVSELIGKSSAVLHSDGLKLYEAIKEIAATNEVTITFEGISHCTTAFLNASIGKFVVEDPNKIQYLKFENLGDPKSLIKEKIDLVLENARDQKKRALMDKGSRSFFYA